MMLSRYLQPSFRRMNIGHSVISSLVCASLLAVTPVSAAQRTCLMLVLIKSALSLD